MSTLMEPSEAIPTRFRITAAARERFGDRLDQLAPYLLQGDPLADAVAELTTGTNRAEVWRMFEAAANQGIAQVTDPPEALRAFFDTVESAPPWVDMRELERAGDVVLRAGRLSGLVLALDSLVFGYCSPAGNKPLVFSGKLAKRTRRRLDETGRFVHAVCLPGGMRRGAEGYVISLKVRLMHAQIRRLLLQDDRWQLRDWGVPINQHDMVATTILFSASVLRGLRRLGFGVSAKEAAGYVALWRYVGELMGVAPEILPRSETEGLELAELILATQEPPDDDARALTQALLGAPLFADSAPTPTQRAFASAICRYLIGDEMADHLQLPRSSWGLAGPGIRAIVGNLDRLRRLPLVDSFLLWQGRKHWRMAIEMGSGLLPTYAPPRYLG
jgi:hypothetical protein